VGAGCKRVGVGEVGDGRELGGGGAAGLAASQVVAAECVGVTESLEDVAARADGALAAVARRLQLLAAGV
jgi:hypothetical protein